MTSIVLIPPSFTPAIWNQALPLIEKVLTRGHGSYKARDVFERCKSGAYRLWMVWREKPIAAVVTEFCQYPQKRTCIIRMLGSDGMPEEWADLLSQIEVWAKDNGCSAMEVFGREGWKRKLKGYELQQVVMRKEL
jgi:hypothetical protein